MPKPRLLLALTVTLALTASAAGCRPGEIVPRAAPGVRVASITVTSPSFREGGRIPVDFTCDGEDVSPELVFSAPPEGTRSLLVIVDDLSAPSRPFTHMVAFDLPPSLHRLPAGTDLRNAGERARFGLNDDGAARYSGPCPPRGELHRYRFRVIAVNEVLALPEGASRARVDQAIDGHVLGEGELTALFGH